ncbi:RibD family protein [Paludibacterium sp. THUN1379]|uniref:dihydrofolate reductase family protein n=1 Tax=Paludibacterium sp. THUN1379 TaxID=3112107 RepID=UPI00308CFD81|nr:RibD family protein [Paludibacterium sp. THUN1379]
MRPKIICHMISSVDGRLQVERWSPPAKGLATGFVTPIYDEVAGRLNGQGWIVGRKSMEPMTLGGDKPVATAETFPRTTHIGNRAGRTIAAAIDPHGKLHYGADGISSEHFVAILGEQVSDAYLAELRADGVSYVFAGQDGHDLTKALESLGSEFGVDTLLLEGGGLTNGAFLKAGLIDELSLLIYPGIDGLAGVSSIFEYQGAADERPAAGRSLRHFATETLANGVVWLRYRFEDYFD